MKSLLSPIKEIIKDLSKGKMVVIVDDEKEKMKVIFYFVHPK